MFKIGAFKEALKNLNTRCNGKYQKFNEVILWSTKEYTIAFMDISEIQEYKLKNNLILILKKDGEKILLTLDGPERYLGGF